MNDSEKIAAIKKELETINGETSVEDALDILKNILHIAYTEFDWDAYADELADGIV